MQPSCALTGIDLSEYSLFPNFLFHLKLNETAKIVYVRLLSRKFNNDNTNETHLTEDGRLYIHYTAEDLARDVNKAVPTIHKCLKELKNAGLIEIEPVYGQKPSRIYFTKKAKEFNEVNK